MAAEMKVTDAAAAVLEASFSKLQYTENLRDALRLTMEDALAAMLEPVGVLSPLGAERVTEGDDAVSLFPLRTLDAQDTIVYRIKESK